MGVAKAWKGPNVPVIGITGRAGSGKSLVAAMFRRRGARVIDADRMGHRLLWRSSSCYKKIVNDFGHGILGRNGVIDRRKLGELVFTDDKVRRRLNRIVHPELVRNVIKKINELKNKRGGPVVVDAALLADWGIHREMDRVVVVDAPARLRLKRLEAKGVPRERARGILAAQIPPARLKELADEVIDNSGTVGRLERRAGEAWGRLMRSIRKSTR